MKAAFFGSIAVALGLLFVSCAGTGPMGSEAVRSAPSIDAVTGLNDKLFWIKSNAVTGGEYVIMLDSDEGALTAGNLTFKNKSNITITIRNTGENRVIYPASPSMHFTVGSGVTLVLDGNITLQGLPNEDKILSSSYSMVSVSSGGTFVMNDGSAIIGNTNNYGIHGGGVYVSAGGAFYMYGGTISGNKCIAGQSLISSVLLSQAVGNALAGAASNKLSAQSNKNAKAFGNALGDAAVKNAANPLYPVSKGGGVYVHGAGVALFGKPDPAGIFSKTGGTITGYDSDPENGNVVMDGGWPVSGQGSPPAPYTVSVNGGHAIYIGGKEPKSLNTTVGPDMGIEFRDGVYTETRSVRPKPVEIIAEAEPADAAPITDFGAEPKVSAAWGEAAESAEAEQEEAAPAPPEPEEEQTRYAPLAQAAPNLRRDPPPEPEPARQVSDGMPRIAAYVFGAEDSALNKAMATRLMAALSNSGRYQVANDYEEFLDKAANERKDSASSAERVKRLGRQFNVEYVCVAEISKAFGEQQAVAHILNVESARVVAAGAGDTPLKTLADLTAASEQIVEAMFKKGKRATLSGVAPVVSASSRIIFADGAFTDNRDGKTYRTIKIGGDRVWMAENLNYLAQGGGSWCYEGGESNCDRYGRLYDWETANAACPEGWRLPSNQEWETLVAASGGQTVSAMKLKAKNGWNDGGDGTNDYGFAALPGGRRRHDDGGFENLGTDGHWWTSTPSGTKFAYTRNMSHRLNNVYANYYDYKDTGFSVRCVQE